LFSTARLDAAVIRGQSWSRAGSDDEGWGGAVAAGSDDEGWGGAVAAGSDDEGWGGAVAAGAGDPTTGAFSFADAISGLVSVFPPLASPPADAADWLVAAAAAAASVAIGLAPGAPAAPGEDGEGEADTDAFF
jgi:hypothetical protein